MELVDRNDYDIYTIGDALWSGGKDWWSTYTDSQKEFLFDYFQSYAYDQEESPTLTEFNDFIWFESQDVLVENDLMFDDIETDEFSIYLDESDNEKYLRFDENFLDIIRRMQTEFDNWDDYDDFADWFADNCETDNITLDNCFGLIELFDDAYEVKDEADTFVSYVYNVER